ncbi:HIRAN domain-containing protein [Paeniglutamicibacter gangotriensis]|uniref:HIRAN domain-containing protein n=1 Tax=Paeniglutamicibacter gangotriensis TaxID=254787 RepID=UPI0037C97CA7
MGLLQKLFGFRSNRNVALDETTDRAAASVISETVEYDPYAGVRERYRDLAPRKANELERQARGFDKQRERQAKIYDREREQAAAAGKTVKQLRAGLLGTEGTKSALLALKTDGEELPKFRIRSCGRGLAVALPDGRVIDPTNVYLRPWNIYGAKIMGTAYYKAGGAQRRDGQQLSLKREPKNEHDPNAVAVMTRSGSAKIGYVAKGQAKFVAKALDGGLDLVAHTMMDGKQVLITTPETWSAINR